MNTEIILAALKNMILADDYAGVSHDQRENALAEYVRLKTPITSVDTRVLWNGSMADFREHRRNNTRIATIKMVRSVLQCGLSEALIIVKGIETHDNIPE